MDKRVVLKRQNDRQRKKNIISKIVGKLKDLLLKETLHRKTGSRTFSHFYRIRGIMKIHVE